MKVSSILLLLAVIFDCGYAQKPDFGVLAGLNFAKWKPGELSDQVENRFRVGLLAGVHGEVGITGNVHLRIELQLAAFGTTLTSGSEKARYKTSYMLIPALGEYRFKNRLSVCAGPQLGLRMGAKSLIDGEKYDNKDDVRSSDLFLVLGAQYPLNDQLRIGMRYQHGLRNIANDADISLHNRALSLIASYRIDESVISRIQKLLRPDPHSR